MTATYCNQIVASYGELNCELCSGEKQFAFDEILPLYAAVSKITDTGTFADFMEAFKTYDREGQGFISGAELRHVLQSLGENNLLPKFSAKIVHVFLLGK